MIERETSLPWADDEFVRVNGFNLVYTGNPGEDYCLVHLPGRRTVTMAVLRDRHPALDLPKRPRLRL